jgi:hypothetical protein
MALPLRREEPQQSHGSHDFDCDVGSHRWIRLDKLKYVIEEAVLVTRKDLKTIAQLPFLTIFQILVERGISLTCPVNSHPNLAHRLLEC